jgi:prepilin-type N-terminal cleavage/methylation domain-containing protein
MMKKNGFTLAEVLITLAIIGVVASLTLPALMTNTKEQQAATAYKKLLNTLTEANQMNQAVSGFDMSSAASTGDATNSYEANNNMTIGAVVHDRLSLVPGKEKVDLKRGGTGPSDCAILTDGTSVCLDSSYVKLNQDDYAIILVDTNGTKGPNTLGKCKDAACSKENRFINDQYYVTIKGGIAYPGYWTDNKGTLSGEYSNAALYLSGVRTSNN